MYMRFLQLQIDERYTDKFKQFYEENIAPKLQETPGCLFAGLINTSGKNEFISLTFWQSLQHAENYENKGVFRYLFDEIKPFLSESTEWKVNLSDEMELEYSPENNEPVIKKYSVKAQKNENEKFVIANSNMFVRIVSAKIQNGKIEEFKKIYKENIIPELKSVNGCRYVYLIESVNVENEFISLTIWDDKKYAEKYEAEGKFTELVNKVKHTFSHFYLWKMALEKDYNAQVQTSDDLKVEHYNIVTGKSFE